jgi:hypothetical protein
MELHSRVSKVALAAALGLFAIAGSQESRASEHRYLCTSVIGACEYAPPTAPSLEADVCWNGTTAVLKGASVCPTGSWAYYLTHGEVVDVVTNEVQGYVPLDDGCDHGHCDVKPPGAGPTEPGPMCCGTEGCTATTECSSSDTLLWCLDGEEPQNQGGTWKCYEQD